MSPSGQERAARGSDYLLVFAAVTCWALTGIVFALVLRSVTISPLTVVYLRALTAMTLLALYLLLFRRGDLVIQRGDLPRLATLGLAYVTILYPALIYSYQLNGVPVATALLYLFPAITLLASARWYGEILTRHKVLALLLCLAGTVFAVAPWRTGDARFSPVGVGLGVVSALSFSYFAISLRPLLGRYHFTTVLFYTLLLGSLGLLPVQIIAGSAFPDAWTLLRIGLAAGVLVTLLPLLLYMIALRRLAAGNAGIAATIEPVLTLIFAAAFLGQFVVPVQLLGIALTTSGVLLLTLGHGRRALQG